MTKTPEELAAIRERLNAYDLLGGFVGYEHVEEARKDARTLLTAYDEQAREIERLRSDTNSHRRLVYLLIKRADGRVLLRRSDLEDIPPTAIFEREDFLEGSFELRIKEQQNER